MVRWEPRDDSDDAVSPVVGMVLVLGVSIVGIAAILYWGLPAIDEMKANVEHQSVESQFQELDSSIKELVAGTTEKTAKRWQPTLNRGQVALVNETEGWVYATEMYDGAKDHSFLYSGFDNTDNVFTIRNVGSHDLAAVTVQAYRVNGTTSGHALFVMEDGPADTVKMDAQAWARYPSGADLELRLKDAEGATGQAVPIKNATIRLRIYEGAVKIAEAWFVPTGRIDYTLEAGLGTKTVTQNNGAVISGNGQTSALLNPPPIPPVSTTAGVPRAFARALLLNATGSFAGNDRFDVLVTLYSTSTLASYDCTKTDKSDCVESTKLFLFGTNKATWHNYLTNTGRGYTFTEASGIGGATYLYDREPSMGYTLLQSTVQLTSER